MRMTLVTIGSRGDVQPFLAAAVGLKRAGHDVRLATHEPFRKFITDHGVDFAPLAGDPEAMLKSEVGQRMMSSENKLAAAREYVQMLEPLAIPCAQNAKAACADAEVILCSSSAYLYGEALGEHYKVPLFQLSIYPMAPSRTQSGPWSTPWPEWGKKLDLLGGHWYHQKLVLDLQTMLFRKQTNDFRREVFQLPPRGRGWGMKTFSRQGHTWIYGYSPHVIPKPRDWNERQHVVGWWFLDAGADWQPPESLERFLAAGPPPVYVGFGSMVSPYRERLAGGVMEAIRQSGQRAVLAKGWGLIDPDHAPDNCYLLDAAPHDWLFPRMAAVVHHGGAGTTGAGVRAGVPNLIVPFAGDQPFWGRTLNQAGMAPPPIPAKDLTADNLAAAIRTMVNTPAMKSRAAELGEKIRAENGVQRTVEIIEREVG